jgi:hypothetical protein
VQVAARSLGGDCQRQAGFADAARAGQRQQPAGRVVEQLGDLGLLGRATDERCGRMRQGCRLSAVGGQRCGRHGRRWASQ